MAVQVKSYFASDTYDRPLPLCPLTVLGPACKDWTHTSNFDRAAAIHASALLRKIGIFDNEFDSLSAFLFGAKAVNLSVKVASVHGNLLTFVLVK